MIETRISAKTVVEGQVPLFMQEEYPLFGPFLKQYYESQDHFSSPITIVKNIDQFLKVGTYTSLIVRNEKTVTTQFVDYTDSTIYVESTAGWPDRYGLLKINDEIITYTGIGSTSFSGCIRGFSGITTYNFYGKQVSYETSENDAHEVGSKVENLSTLFLKEFFKQIKSQFLPGFDNIDFYGNLKQSNLLIQSKDFYTTKGTPVANNILFKSLYGEEVETIKPQDYLLRPSSSDYRPVRQLVVSSLSGNPLDLSGKTLIQEIKTPNGITSSYGSVSDVEPNFRGGEQYYTVDIDFGYDRDTRTFGSLFGEFKIHPKTKVVGIAGSSLIVDSTVGFANSGSIFVNDVLVNYTEKTNSEFVNCVGISTVSIGENVISSNYTTYGIDSDGNRIEVRVTGVLEKVNVEENSNYYEPNDPIIIKSLGIIKDKKDAKFNSWKFNTSTKFNASSITWNGQYFVIETYDDHELYLNDDLQFINKVNGSIFSGKVRKILSDKKIQVSSNLDPNESDLYKKYFIRRITNVSTNTLTGGNSFKQDIQDVYDDKGDVIVTSGSLPSYEVKANDRTKSATVSVGSTVTELLIPNHNFYSGDIVYVSSLSENFKNNIRNYFIKKVDNNTVKLALSNSNIDNNLFYEISNNSTSPITLNLTPLDNTNKKLTSQKLVRRINSPVNDSKKQKTIANERLGILVNGVEILNYKAKEVVYYGAIESIDVLDGGEDYDVINPPVVSIEDSTGVGATGNCAVSGSLKKIDILYSGFDYLEVPAINISGGNGTGAVAQAKLSKINHDVYLNASGISTSLGGFIDTSTNIIGFNTEHKFNVGEGVIYNSFNGTKIGIGSTSGDTATKLYLQDDSIYYISIVDDYKVKLHNKQEDAISLVNEINITSAGTGNQRFRSTRRKNILTSVNVINGGSGYENKLRSVSPSGISTSNNSINIPNHDFKSGEIVTYSTLGSSIVGLDTSINYYVVKLDDDNFRLCPAGIGTTLSDLNYLTNQYALFETKGNSTHFFNYPPLTVTVNGIIGVSRTDSAKYQATVSAEFRGSITSIQITNGGSGYGSTDIINFDKQPDIKLNSGSDAILKPIIVGEKINSVVVLNSGKDYNSTPSFSFSGGGSYAKISPVINNGKITSINVINGGIGFSTNKSNITVTASGKNVKLRANIKKWTVNLVEKYKNLFSQSNDDGILIPGIVSGLQYVNLFAPRHLRETLPSKNTDGSNNYNNYDLKFDDFERLSSNHSPIIGWAYDGNPIYGPYGYSLTSGGTVKAMSSGYVQVSNQERPTGFPDGFFVEDYTFVNNGDLDESNGRFCKTPEYPNGVYAYFATINPNSDGFDTNYGNYRRPVFPYLIGDVFKSKPNKFNSLPSSSQNNFNLTEGNYIKNTYPYKLNNTESEYEFITQPFKISEQLSLIEETSTGSIESVGILSAGINYKIGDSVFFDNTNTNGRGATARVKEIFEKRIVSIENATNTVENVSINIVDRNGTVEGITTIPHNFSNLDFVNISKISDEKFIKLSGFHEIEVPKNNFVLSVGLGTTGITGITTFVYLTNLNGTNIRTNDVLKITKTGVGTENLLVLSIDTVFNRVKVKREHNGTSGFAYSAYTSVEDDPRRFTYNSGFSTSIGTKVRRKIYFDPNSSVAIGTVGSGTTISFEEGFSSKQKFVRLQSIYIPNHGLESGQKLVYSNEGHSSLSVFTFDSGTNLLNNGQNVYVAKFTNDLIGIATLPIGIGSTGGFVGVGFTSNLLYFTSTGTGNYHSFETQEQELTATSQKNVCTLTSKQNHGMSVGGNITLNVLPGLSTTIILKYNSANRRLVANPKSFSGSGIDTSRNTITLQNHEYVTGDKVIYTSSNPASGLINDKIYYIVRIDNNSFKLVDSIYQSSVSNPNYISIASTGISHELSQVNPPINIINGYTVNFDLSDPSLADSDGGSKVQSFDFDLFTDSSFTNKFVTSLNSPTFEVTKVGTIGVTNNAKLTLTVNEFIPKKLYYKLTPLNGKSYLTKEKSEVIVDRDVIDGSSLNYENSKFNGSYNIVGVGSTTFTFNLKSYPEKSTYTESDATIEYKTKESTATGSISNVEVLFGGVSYDTLPGITSVSSVNGSGAVLRPNGKNIGKVLKSIVQTPGFEYPSDPTLKPISEIPQRLYIEQLYTIDSVGLTTGGKNYSIPPSFIVIDPVTGDIKSEVKLQASLSGNIVSDVKILANTKTLYGLPRIIPINNNNGIGVTNVSFNNISKLVTINLATGFSTAKAFPFNVGDKILIEGIGVGTTGTGYNSANYGYELFTLTGVTSAIGGSTGILTFKLDKGSNPGIFSAENSTSNGSNSFGRVIPESYLPKFNPKVSLGEFKYNKGEEIYIGEQRVGRVVSWNPISKLLKLNEFSREILPGELIRGKSTDNKSVVVESYSSSGDFTVSYFNQKLKEYSQDTGKLSTFLQVLQDGDYYQNFSYSLKSRVPIEKWEDKVSLLTHTSGFKKFSDLQIESEPVGIGTTLDILLSDTSVFVDLIQEKSFDCYENFAFAKEFTKTFGGALISDQIYFDNLRLTDYTEFLSNRVLEIDNISDQFDDTPSIFNYAVVGTFDITKYNSAQFYILIKDARYYGEKEIIIVNVVYDGSNGYLTAYGRNETVLDLGSFSFRRVGNIGEILFYPQKYEYNSYNMSNISVNIAGAGTSTVGISSLGEVVSFASTAVAISSSPSPSANTIVSISTNSYSSAKILLSASSSDDNVQFNEINLTHNGNDVYYEFFGDVDSGDLTSSFGQGIVGSVGITSSSGNILVTFTPNENLNADVRALSILIGNTSSVGVGTSILYKGELSSHYVSIASSSSPQTSVIAGFGTTSKDPHEGALYYVQIHDTSNNRVQLSELVLTNDSSYNPALSEYAVLTSDVELGVIGAARSTYGTNLTFVPLPNIDVQVRVYQKTLQVTPKQSPNDIDLNSAIIRSDTTSFNFEGTQLSTKKEFNLTHKSSPIFRKVIDGSSTSVVDLSNNTISIPNHFFVTGEKIDYSVTNGDGRIGIATTSIAGVGTTSLLPTTLYAVKINDSLIKFADTPEKALKFNPEVLDITSVGIGASHVFTSNYKSNSKSLICIDNIIQSPILQTNKTSYIVQDTDDVNSVSLVYFDDVRGFYAKDLIKIDDEFLLITDIGIGATNAVSCRREQMGTIASSHTNGATITKYSGNYNIVDDIIYFVEAPHGDEADSESISDFQGRIFLRSQPVGSSGSAYSNNNIFDDISDQFNGTRNTFGLKTQGNNISGIVSTTSVSAGILLVNNIFQKPKYPATGVAQTFTYEVIENSGISSVVFSGNSVGLSTNNITGPMKFDINSAGIPRGGIIVSVASTQGYGFQPLVAAGGTAIVSVAGTIQSISIGNSGSGYRSGIQTSIIVSIANSIGENIAIGTASAVNGNIVAIAVTYSGIGYTTTNPPTILIDPPLNYENISLIYDSSNNGIGTEAKANIVVGYGNSVIDFNITNTGYGYSVGNVLTVEIGGTTGIPTVTSLSYKPFNITVNEIFKDSFNAWYPGQFVVLDDFDGEFDGFKKTFKLKENGVLSNFVSAKGSPLELDQNLLIFINDVLQVPGESYKFEGGSQVEFYEAPKSGSSVKILFYKGSDADIRSVDVEPTIKVGDKLTLTDRIRSLRDVYTENPRVVSEISFVDSVYTNSYFGPGITSDSSIVRTVEWCKQREDFFLDEVLISKSREELNSLIFPITNLIRPVGVGSTVFFVQNTKALFNYAPEILPAAKQTLKIINQDEKLGAIATAVVSVAGTISNIIINNGGVGFTTVPPITISLPSSGTIAIATCTISGIGTVDSITITNPGSGYTTTNPPQVLIEAETFKSETITNALYEGDFGIISGVGTTSISGVSTGIAFDFYIPKDSILRNSNEVGVALTVSGIQTGYYFVISNSIIGNGVTSINDDGTTLGIGSTYLDNVYQAFSVQNITGNAIGVGSTTELLRVITSIKSYNGITGLGNSQFFGLFSWGRIYEFDRGPDPQSFNVDLSNGISGLGTAPIIIRSNPMRSLYTS